MTALFGFDNAAEISYQFAGTNGFTAIVALVQQATGTAPAPIVWGTNIEGGVNFAQGWGSIGAMFGYDIQNAAWGAKGVVRFTAPNSGFSAGLHAFYASSGNPSGWNSYRVHGFGAAGVAGLVYQQNWSVLGHVTYQATPTVNLNLLAQWFDAPAFNGGWQFGGSVGWTPVPGLLIRPEIRYTANGLGARAWDGLVRFQRDF